MGPELETAPETQARETDNESGPFPCKICSKTYTKRMIWLISIYVRVCLLLNVLARDFEKSTRAVLPEETWA